MKISKNGIELIVHFEGEHLQAYLDPVGIPTIGVGATFYQDGRRVKMGDKITKQESRDLLAFHLEKFEKTVLEKVKRPLKQNEFDALVSFCFNAGTSYRSAAGQWRDYEIWKRADQKTPGMKEYWENLAVTAKGKRLNGLVRRRKAEAALYLDT